MMGCGGFNFVIFPSFPLRARHTMPFSSTLTSSVLETALPEMVSSLIDFLALEELPAGADRDDRNDRRSARERFRRFIFPRRPFAGRQELVRRTDGNGRENECDEEK